MSSQIVEIDLALLDKEIEEIKNQLKSRIELKEFLINYGTPIKPNRIQGSTNLQTTMSNMGGGYSVSEYILNVLKEGRKDSKDIVKGYATYLKKDPKDVANNIGNALSRLKVAEKIDSLPIEGARGSIYFLK